MNTRDLLTGAGVGAAVAFMLDPDRGRRRRALVRDKMTRATHLTRDGLDATARDLSNRARGIVAATRGRFSEGVVSDERLAARVRAKLGRVSSHPRAIEVFARDGEVILRGQILADEAMHAIDYVSSIRGVRDVINELELYETAEGVPSLQGAGRTAGWDLDIMQSNWAPATRALVSASVIATGVCLAAYARRNRGDRLHSYAA